MSDRTTGSTTEARVEAGVEAVNSQPEFFKFVSSDYYHDDETPGYKFGNAKKSASTIGEVFRFEELEGATQRSLICGMQIHSRSAEAYEKLKGEAMLDGSLEIVETEKSLKLFARFTYSYSVATGNSFNHIFENTGFQNTIKDNKFLVILNGGSKIRFSNRGSRF